MKKSYLKNILPLKIDDKVIMLYYLSYRKNIHDIIYLFCHIFLMDEYYYIKLLSTTWKNNI